MVVKSFIGLAHGLMFGSKVGTYPSCAPLGRLLALPANIGIGRKCLPVVNTLAYYEH
jgi:hypothetical protein